MSKIICVSVGCADATVIQTGQGTLLVDCYRGEDYGKGTDDFANYLPASKVLKAVFITHQHKDHFGGLFYLQSRGYSIEYLIYSPYKRRPLDTSVEYDEWVEFQGYKTYFEKQGAKCCTPYRQDSFKQPWWTVLGIKVWMLGPSRSIATSPEREIHDASLVMQFTFASGRSMFTGDASDKSLQDIHDTTSTYGGDLLHASHHGSIEGACLDFIKRAKPTYTVISTKAGVYPNVPHPTAITRYKDNTSKEVYRTDDNTWTFTR